MTWVLVGLVLVLAATVVVGAALWSLWSRSRRLMAELSATGDALESARSATGRSPDVGTSAPHPPRSDPGTA